jgi:hypothetical protein
MTTQIQRQSQAKISNITNCMIKSNFSFLAVLLAKRNRKKCVLRDLKRKLQDLRYAGIGNIYCGGMVVLRPLPHSLSLYYHTLADIVHTVNSTVNTNTAITTDGQSKQWDITVCMQLRMEVALRCTNKLCEL